MRPVLLPLALLTAMPQEPRDAPAPRRPALPTAEETLRLPPDGGPRYNRLVFEASPYLRQHAANPVDWYPWGEEAFARARALDRPVFLSIGYSTCHWCHVMEHESFEDERVAALMNEAFVCVKVDREERPDLDQVYMSVTQALTGAGGWPMTVLLTPDARPFFAATYVPRESRHGRAGMLELVPRIAEAWRTRRDELAGDAERIVAHVARLSAEPAGAAPGKDALALAVRQLAQSYEPAHGGFSQRPKFPVPHNLLFLLQAHARGGNERTLEMVTHTLDAMRAGGVFDQVGFGFHRYSTDAEWLVPHFEKMLYDQALVAMAYVAAWQVTGDAAYRRTAEEVYAYVLRDLTSPEGAFWSAEDADSEGEEGLFYLWTADELARVLGAEDARVFARAYGILPEGNFRDEASGLRSGRNIPHLPRPLAETARELELAPEALAARLEAMRRALFAAREAREHPFKDDKVLTDWNGLMIASLARAAAAFDEPRYAAAAARAADWVLGALVGADGRLLKRARAGQAGLPATLEDHAFLCWGLFELYQATFEERWLRAALDLADRMLARFADAEHGGFFLSADDAEALIVRPKDAYDGALPSGNSVAALVLARLGRLSADERYEEAARGVLRAFGRRLAEAPVAHTMLLDALDFLALPSYEVVIAGEPGAPDTRAMLRALQRPFLPNKVVVLRPPGDEPSIAELVPYTADQRPLEGRATAYVCRNFACSLPTTDPARMLALLAP